MLFKNSYCLNLKHENSTMFVFHYILHSYMPRIYDMKVIFDAKYDHCTDE